MLVGQNEVEESGMTRGVSFGMRRKTLVLMLSQECLPCLLPLING